MLLTLDENKQIVSATNIDTGLSADEFTKQVSDVYGKLTYVADSQPVLPEASQDGDAVSNNIVETASNEDDADKESTDSNASAEQSAADSTSQPTA